MRCVAYTDGSYREDYNTTGDKIAAYGSGVYMVVDGVLEPRELSFGGSDPSIIASRNVTGELRAVVALLQCIEAEYPAVNELDIYYDYEGVEAWVTRAWKANKPLTAEYRDFVREHQRKLKINFHHVKGHSGVSGNVRADELAGRGVQKELKKLGGNS